jgi:ABC-type transporter Mla subunit MlaD
MSNERDNFKAGLFVIVGVVVALIFIWQLADIEQWYTQYQRVKVHYRLSDGVRGLKAGAQVTLGDQPIGTVETIEQVTDGERVTGMLVTVVIPEDIKMYQDAAVELVVPPLGSGTRLNIRSVGATDPYEPSGQIEGQLAGSTLTASLVRDIGIQDEQRQAIRDIIANVRDLTASLKADIPQITASTRALLDDAQPMLEESRQAIANFRAATDDVKQITASVRQRSDQWLTRIDNITDGAESALNTVDRLITDKDPTIRQTLDDLRAMIDNARSISQSLREQTLAQVHAALDKVQTVLDNADHATDELDQFVTSQRPVIERAVANAQIAAGQLKLAAVEIRRSPWRLMYKPIEQELETDNIYDAARSLVLAAEAVQASTDSLRAVAQRSDIDTQTVQTMITDLRSLLDNYSQAENAFWETIRTYQPAAGSGASGRTGASE